MAAQTKVALVTGSSEGGIGAALCEYLLKAGCRVFATARRLETLRNLEAKGCELAQLDVCDEASIKKCVESVVAKAGRIDILVNNAGVGLIGPLMDLPLDAVRKLFETNVFGLIAMTQAVFPVMVKQGGGTIANIGSIAGWLTTPWGVAYCASKAAVESFTDGMRMEMKPHGIDVLLIQPGAIKSNLGKNNVGNSYCNESGPYKAFAAAIQARAGFSQEPGATPTEVFAEKAVAQILKTKPPAHWAFGKHVWTAFLVTRFLPTWLQDWILSRKFGLNRVLTRSKKGD